MKIGLKDLRPGERYKRRKVDAAGGAAEVMEEEHIT